LGRKVYTIVILNITSMEIVVKAKKWGSSLGIVIPKKAVDELGLEEGRELHAELTAAGTGNVLAGLFGRETASPTRGGSCNRAV
jgi:molybdopterin-binding protein